jgi:folate-binding protein YgfZ
VDYDFDTLLPETGLERDTVSYTKGCYLGQETIARVKTYGTVQKALVGLRFEPGVPLPKAPGDCLIAGKKVGELTRSIESPTLQQPIGMAYLGKAERVPGKTLTLQIGETQYTAQVTLLPFYSAIGQQDGATLLQEGLRLFSEGYEEAAIVQLRQALSVQPDSLEAAEALGVILSRQEQYPEAIALMEKILEQDPHHVLAHTNLSVFYMKLGDKEKAEEEKAKATMAAFSQRAKAAGLTFDPEAERRKKEAAALDKIAMFEEALKFSPADPLGNFGLGSSLLELKRYDEAIEPFRKTIQAQPKQSVAYLSLAKCLEGAGQPDEARTVLETGIAVAAAKGDLMPLKEMQARLESLTP